MALPRKMFYLNALLHLAVRALLSFFISYWLSVLFADGADYLREILPAFFVHHNINIKRLRRIVHKLPSQDGKRQGRNTELNSSELHQRLNAWIASATAEEIRKLPSVLTNAGASGAGERLDQKLKRVDSQLKTECRGNEVEMVDVPK